MIACPVFVLQAAGGSNATNTPLRHADTGEIGDGGGQGRQPLHETSVQKAIRKAAKEAGIHKLVGPHTFRHSFATHLLQTGTDIRKIQELLGHKDLKTTMVYTHVAGLDAGLKSPLDSLDISDPLGL